MNKTYDLRGHFLTEQPIATCSKDLKDREGGSGLPDPVPHTRLEHGRHLYIPATTVRGALRRACRDVLRTAIINKTGNPKPFSLEQHYLLTLGGIKGGGESERSTVAMEAAWRDRNPLLSIFGAGDAGVLSFVHGRLNVANAITEDPCSEVIFSGARTDDLYRDKDQVAFLSDSDVDRLISGSIGNKSRSSLQASIKVLEKSLRAAKSDPTATAAISAQIAAAKEQIKTVKETTGAADVSIGRPLEGFKAIPQGVRLNHRMTLLRSNDIELGLLLKSLNRFATQPILGAHAATGCGLVSGGWEVFEVTEEGRTSLGHIAFDAFSPLDVQGEALVSALGAYSAWIASDVPDMAIPHSEV